MTNWRCGASIAMSAEKKTNETMPLISQGLFQPNRPEDCMGTNHSDTAQAATKPGQIQMAVIGMSRERMGYLALSNMAKVTQSWTEWVITI